MANMATAMTKEVIYLDVDKIFPNPNQPRKVFVENQLEELASSISEHGLLQPVSVRYIRGKYELIAGERRLRACKKAEIKYIPAIIINLSDENSAYLAIIENLQRQDLNFIEEAAGIYRLINEFNLTQEQLAKKIGKNQSTVANKLRLLKLSDEVKEMLIEYGLTERHGRALLKLPKEEDRLKVIEKVIDLEMNVKKTEDYIEKYLEKNQKTKKDENEYKIKRIIKDIRLFTNTIKQAVDMMEESGLKTNYELKETEEGCIITIGVDYKV